MTPVSYAVPTEKTSPRFAQAFAMGCGGEVCTTTTLKDGPVAMFGSPSRWPLLQEAFRRGRQVFYGDHGYFGRTRYFRITRNAYQHDGSGAATSARFDVFGRQVQPWRSDGRHVLICPNSPAYFSLFGMDVHEWVKSAVETIAAHTTRPVKVRWKGQAEPIELDLVNCWAVVAFSSAAALDALIAGVPVFVLADFAAAYRFGSADLSEIESPTYPEGREQLMWNLACQQWTLDEIRTGVAWRALRAQS